MLRPRVLICIVLFVAVIIYMTVSGSVLDAVFGRLEDYADTCAEVSRSSGDCSLVFNSFINEYESALPLIRITVRADEYSEIDALIHRIRQGSSSDAAGLYEELVFAVRHVRQNNSFAPEAILR